MPFSLEADAKRVVCIPPHKCTSGHGGIDDGVAIDTLGFEWALFMPALWADDSNGTSQYYLQEADSASGPWTTITGASWSADNTVDDQAMAHVRLTPRKRWLRCSVLTTGGNHNHISVVALLYNVSSEQLLEVGAFAVSI